MTQYAIDAAKLVEKCRLLLGAILCILEERSPSEKSFRRKALQLLGLADGQMNSLDTITSLPGVRALIYFIRAHQP